VSTEAFLIRVPPSRAQEMVGDVSVTRKIVEETAAGSEQRLELDEAWAPLHFGLTGAPPVPRQEAEDLGLGWDEQSLENVLMGGEATPLMAGFGAARYVSPALVRSMASRLADISAASFRSRVEPQAMVQERVFPDSWDLDAVPDLMEHYFTKLRDFYAAAAAHGDGLLIAVG
jgi:hypothetical protein